MTKAIRRLVVIVGAVVALFVLPSWAAAGPLPDGCTREQGTVTCTTTEGPGNNQGGVGETTVTETQGNTSNKSPEDQQDLDDSQSCKPPKSQGEPCNP